MLTDAPARERALDFSNPGVIFLTSLLVITAVRVIGLAFTPLDLHGDEAQYWFWSRELAWGYFSKPPLIAWAIAATTSVFGDAEWAVRLFAPLAHAGGAAALFFLGRRLYGAQAGLWAGLGWLVMPGVWLSASIASTDALLLPLWSLALLSLFALTQNGSYRWAVVLGAAIGFGFLAKYAMSYFLIGAALAIIVAPQARRALLSPRGALALAIAAAILAPNIAWNAAHEFQTISHTAENANLAQGLRFSFAEVGQFVADQLAVFGPLPWIALVAALIPLLKAPSKLAERERILLCFIAPPLLIILVQAFLSRAHANWAASAYPAAMVLFAGLALARPFDGPRTKRAAVIGGVALILGAAAAAADLDLLVIPFALALIYALVSIGVAGGSRAPAIAVGLHCVLGAVFISAALWPSFANAVGLADAFKRSRGWQETAVLVAQRAARSEEPYSAIVVDDRLLFNDLAYYWRDGAPAPLRMWVLNAEPGNHAESVAALTPQFGESVLIVGASPRYEPIIAQDFAAVGPLQRVEIDLGGGEFRRLSFREARRFEPVAR